MVCCTTFSQFFFNLIMKVFRAGVCRPCVETELTATSRNFSLGLRVKNVFVDRRLIGYS